MHTDTIQYECDDVMLRGYLAFSKDIVAKRPAVIVAHAWRGLDEFARQQARALAELGYVGFAADVYGQGITVESNEEAANLMLPLFLDRALLRKRMNAAVDILKEHPMVDPEAIGAIGFCFGGLTAIELLRSGADVLGVVSFHGLLGNTLGEYKAAIVPNAPNIKGALLILHGYQDPLVSAEDVINIQNECNRAGLDWQMYTYGKAKHAFTNPNAQDDKSGLVYNAQAAMRSWQAMCNFFEEIFP